MRWSRASPVVHWRLTSARPRRPCPRLARGRGALEAVWRVTRDARGWPVRAWERAALSCRHVASPRSRVVGVRRVSRSASLSLFRLMTSARFACGLRLLGPLCPPARRGRSARRSLSRSATSTGCSRSSTGASRRASRSTRCEHTLGSISAQYATSDRSSSPVRMVSSSRRERGAPAARPRGALVDPRSSLLLLASPAVRL